MPPKKKQVLQESETNDVTEGSENPETSETPVIPEGEPPVEITQEAEEPVQETAEEPTEIPEADVTADVEDTAEIVVPESEEISENRADVLELLGITEADVMSYRKYSETSVVVVTWGGRKLLHGTDPGSGSLYNNKPKTVQKKS